MVMRKICFMSLLWIICVFTIKLFKTCVQSDILRLFSGGGGTSNKFPKMHLKSRLSCVIYHYEWKQKFIVISYFFTIRTCEMTDWALRFHPDVQTDRKKRWFNSVWTWSLSAVCHTGTLNYPPRNILADFNIPLLGVFAFLILLTLLFLAKWLFMLHLSSFSPLLCKMSAQTTLIQE